MVETPTRRLLLGAAVGLAAAVAASCGATSSAPSTSSAAAEKSAITPVRHNYGGDPSQFLDVYRPAGTPKTGLIVLVHGGFWLSQYTLSLGAPLAVDLARRGYVAVNLEYRRVGDGGGWPTTLLDVAAGFDSLQALGLDTPSVVAVGHSAGGQLAAWAAARPALPPTAPGSGPRQRLHGVVSQAGVLALAQAQLQGVGGSAVSNFLGGSAAQRPARYRVADPLSLIPLNVPLICVHSHADQNVPYSQSVSYVEAARAAGASARLITVAGDHFTLIDPTSPAWAVVVHSLPSLIGI